MEKAGFIAGDGVNAVAGFPNGTINLLVGMFDPLGFEVYQDTFALHLGIAQGDNTLCTSDRAARRPA